MSRLLLLAGPSVPSPTGTPAAHISGTGAAPPLASFMFETGQCATLTPFFPKSDTSLFVSQTECAANTLSHKNPILSRNNPTRIFFSRVSNFLHVKVHVH